MLRNTNRVCVVAFAVILIPNILKAQTRSTMQDGTSEGYVVVNPKTEPFPPKGIEFQNKKLQDNINAAPVASVPYTYDWIAYNYIICSVDWDQNCEGTYNIEAPAGWQACKSLYSVSKSERGSSYSVTPNNWYTNDPETPDRFRAYNVKLSAKGSGIIFDRWGSNVNLTNVGIRLISASATNNDRYAAGCEMPSHD